jgi:hypothetical protein
MQGVASASTADRVRLVAIALSVLAFAMPIAFALAIPHPLEQPFGVDLRLYLDATQRWLAGGPFYQPYQLAGPYEIQAGDILYPPVALWLFVPFAVVAASPLEPLALGLWWAIPLGLTAWAVWRLRPAPFAWPLIALCVAWPTTLLKTWTGNPVIWSMAALAAGVIWFWPAVFVLLKPSLAPFALFGVNHRSWWIALAIFGLLCLPFGSLWLDWLRSVVNSEGGGLLYSSLEIPMLLLPLVAWLARRRGRSIDAGVP